MIEILLLPLAIIAVALNVSDEGVEGDRVVVVECRSELKAAGAEPLTDGRYGLRIHVWDIESRKRSILSSSNTELWEQKLHTCHVPEMVFGDSGLFLEHVKSGATIHFNSFDALVGWKKEALPPVEVPAAAQWKFRTKPSQQLIMDYDYTFTTPYSGK
ncbi:hypothetical protein C1H46_013096 [Malus baccata]|uniref:Uncharacterized protein n=1 Tax=Malus baccata TaxID=106549 RepID=A0A540MSE1_MALBA|nr:hypothetical protein C1H46_013096 [Malus baccata]